MVLGVVRDTGMSLETVIEFSLPAFNELVLSSLRLKYLDKEEDAWTMWVASQQFKEPRKAMEGLVKQWRKLIRRPKKQDNDQAAFIQRMGKGF